MSENRRFGVPRDGTWLHYVGDCGAVATFLETRSASTGWVIVMFLDALLRSFGQLVLANNPVSGAVLLAALCAVQPWAGLAALTCASIAILVAAAAGQQRAAVSAGMASCAATLLGAATVSLLRPEALDGRVWTLLAAGAVVSVYVTSSLSTLVSAVLPPAWWGGVRPRRRARSHGHDDDDIESLMMPAPGKGPWPPLFALPYGLLQLVLLLCLLHSQDGLALRPAFLASPASDTLAVNATAVYPTAVNATVTNATAATITAPNVTLAPTPDADVNVTRVREFYDIDHLDWGQMFQGVLVSASQVVALEDPAVSAAVYIALLVFSPAAACTALAGAFVGSMAGVVLLDPPYTAVYRGMWGVNGMLSMWAVTAHSFVVSWHSVAAGTACVCLTAGLQAALETPLRTSGLPLQLLPHSIAALVFLLVASSARTAFVRPAVLSFPEKHKYDFWTEQEEDEDHARERLPTKRPGSPPVRD